MNPLAWAFLDKQLLIPKQKPLRSKTLRQSAKNEPCVMCGSVGTTVLAHRNVPGHFGVGLKGPDWWGALLCAECHADGDANRKDYIFWEHAVFRTLQKWFNDETLKVNEHRE